MSSRTSLSVYPCLILLLGFTMVITPVMAAEVSNKEIIMRINELKGISLPKDKNEIEKLNKKLDSVWEFLKTYRESAIPILIEELQKELSNPKTDNFFLLDAGHFLISETGKTHAELTFKALTKLDSNSEIIQANFRPLFDITFHFSSTQDSRILPVIDRIFLTTTQNIFIPQHYLTLDPTLMSVFLYGVYGPNSEEHLLNQIKNEPAHTKRVLEILNWIGTQRSIEPIRKIMVSQPSYEIYVRSVGVFMRIGGPKGKNIVLSTNMSNFDAKANEYYRKIKPAIEKQSFQTIYQSLEQAVSKGEKKLPDDVIKQRIKAMYENYGKDDETNPLAFLNSKLPTDYLITELIKIRSRMFYKISDEALDDVQMTNAIVNALLFKRQ